ncbi:MAG: LysR family transcriptional regulator [Pseudomonadota bacterium]
MKLDPRHLAQLSAIVEAGSFQLASEWLGLTQSALSRNMKSLEERLGAPLFQRDGRRSEPNGIALRLAKNGLAIRMAEEQASGHAVNIASGHVGELRLGAPPIVAGRYLSDVLAKFINEHPGCTVELRSGLVSELRALLERGKIDLIIAPHSLAEHSEGLTSHPLTDDRVGILCRTGHRLSAKKKINIRDLEAESWLAHSRGSLLRQQTEAAMVASGVRQIQILCETDSIRSALEIVAATDLITTMPIETTKPYLEDRLTFLPFKHPQLSRPLSAIQLTDIPLNPITSKFLGELRDPAK